MGELLFTHYALRFTPLKSKTRRVKRKGQNVKSETKNMVPLLGKIPLLGYLFKNKTGRRMRTELFILITPRIVTDSVDIDALSEAFRKKLPWLKKEVKKVKIW